MLDLTKLDVYSLVDVRLRLGAEDKNDESFDKKIKNMTPREFVTHYTECHFNDNYWTNIIIDTYENAKEAEI